MNSQYREKGRFAVEKIVKKRKKAFEAMTQAKKRRIVQPNLQDQLKNNLIGNRIINLRMLATSLKCTGCGEIQDIEKCTEEKRSGLQSTFIVPCKCGTTNFIRTSSDHCESEQKYADVNTLAVLGAVHSGAGQTKFNKMLSCMDIPSITPHMYKSYEKYVGKAIEEAAEESCKRAVSEEKRLVLENAQEVYDYL